MKNLAILESDTHSRVAAIKANIQAIRQHAAEEGRPETAAERADIDHMLREAESAKQALDRRRSDDALGERIQALPGQSPGAAAGTILRPGSVAGRLRSMGEAFTHAPEFRWFKESRAQRGQFWESPVAELAWVGGSGFFAATLTSDPASGGDLIVPDYRPDVVPLPQPRFEVSDLLAQATTDSNLVTYMKQTGFTNAADTAAEGGIKPESALVFDAVSDPVRKIAHWVPATEEILEDVPQMRSLIDQQLRLGLQLTLNDQILNGTTTAPDIVGIRNRTGLAPDVAAGVGASNLDAIATQAMNIQNTTGHVPDAVVLNPSDWNSLQLLKLESGEYLGSGPFTRAQAPTLWGMTVVVTPLIEVGVALVGAFSSAAVLFRKGGVRVNSTNSHLDWFTRNQIAIRGELRVALQVSVPQAFGEVTGLNTVVP